MDDVLAPHGVAPVHDVLAFQLASFLCDICFPAAPHVLNIPKDSLYINVLSYLTIYVHYQALVNGVGVEVLKK